MEFVPIKQSLSRIPEYFFSISLYGKDFVFEELSRLKGVPIKRSLLYPLMLWFCTISWDIFYFTKKQDWSGIYLYILMDLKCTIYSKILYLFGCKYFVIFSD